MKLAQHTYSGLFGSFIFNSIKEAIEFERSIAADLHPPPLTNGSPVKSGGDISMTNTDHPKCTFSVWDYLGKHNEEFHNPAYNHRMRKQLVYPKYLPELHFWRDAYCYTPANVFISDLVFL